MDEEMTITTQTAFANILEGVAFFQVFTPEEMNILLSVGKWSKAAPLEKIVHQGERDMRMYVLIQGQAEVIYHDKIIEVIKSGQIFGEIGLMGKPRIAHVESKSECLLIAFEANDLNNLPLELQVKFLRRVLESVFERLQKSNVQKWLNSRSKPAGRKTRSLISRQ